jgi:hypothetical protein
LQKDEGRRWQTWQPKAGDKTLMRMLALISASQVYDQWAHIEVKVVIQKLLYIYKETKGRVARIMGQSRRGL